MITTQPQPPMLPEHVRLLEAWGGCRSELVLAGLAQAAAWAAYVKSMEDLGKFLDDMGRMVGLA